MPLHLLGKKSWNVYNADNISRVRRDEADAAARKEAAEQAMQEEDAARRTAILRGEKPAPLLSPPTTSERDTASRPRDSARSRADDGTGRERKRRRVRGEDDTDRDIRHAREDAETAATARATLSTEGAAATAGHDAPLLDHAGHINLFPAPDERAIRKNQKNAEAEAEKAKKKREFEDQYTMRFSNAAGFKQGLEKPWYAAATQAGKAGNGSEVAIVEDIGKDVWGREDPRRRERQTMRASASDPMAFMQKAQVQLKQAEKDKDKWAAAREREVEDWKSAERRRRKERRRHERKRSEDSLNGFSLDATANDGSRGTRDADHRASHHDRDKGDRSGRERRHRQSSHYEHRKRSRSPR